MIQTWAKPEVASCHHGLGDHPPENVAAARANKLPGTQEPPLPGSHLEDLFTGSHVYQSGNLTLPEAKRPPLHCPCPPGRRLAGTGGGLPGEWVSPSNRRDHPFTRWLSPWLGTGPKVEGKPFQSIYGR